MKTLYKYCSAQRGLSFLDDFKIRYTPPLCFNDPFELRACIEYSQIDFQELLSLNNPRNGVARNFLGHLHDSIGILCLSELEDDISMWSHYGDNHSGIVIGFDSNHEYFSDSLDSGFMFGPILYCDQRPSIDADILEKSGFSYFIDSTIKWDEIVFNNYRDLFFTKSRHWSYEKEWRHIKIFSKEKFPLRDREKFGKMSIKGAYGGFSNFDNQVYNEEIIRVPPEAIVSITLGANIVVQSTGGVDGVEDIVWKKILENPNLSHLKVKRAALDPVSYKVNIADTENIEELSSIFWAREIDFYKQGYVGKEAVKQRLTRGGRFIDPYVYLELERQSTEKLRSKKKLDNG